MKGKLISIYWTLLMLIWGNLEWYSRDLSFSNFIIKLMELRNNSEVRLFACQLSEILSTPLCRSPMSEVLPKLSYNVLVRVRVSLFMRRFQKHYNRKMSDEDAMYNFRYSSAWISWNYFVNESEKILNYLFNLMLLFGTQHWAFTCWLIGKIFISYKKSSFRNYPLSHMNTTVKTTDTWRQTVMSLNQYSIGSLKGT